MARVLCDVYCFGGCDCIGEENEAVCPSPGQLCSQLCHLQGQLQVYILTLSHAPQQAAVLLIQLSVGMFELSHRS